MIKVVAVIVSLLIVGVMVFAVNSTAIAAGKHGGGHHGGHHRGHHGGFWGPTFGWGYVGLGTVVTDDCYMVKKCRINRFGERRCRWVKICY